MHLRADVVSISTDTRESLLLRKCTLSDISKYFSEIAEDVKINLSNQFCLDDPTKVKFSGKESEDYKVLQIRGIFCQNE